MLNDMSIGPSANQPQTNRACLDGWGMAPAILCLFGVFLEPEPRSSARSHGGPDQDCDQQNKRARSSQSPVLPVCAQFPAGIFHFRSDYTTCFPAVRLVVLELLPSRDQRALVGPDRDATPSQREQVTQRYLKSSGSSAHMVVRWQEQQGGPRSRPCLICASERLRRVAALRHLVSTRATARHRTACTSPAIRP
jgi:hypothetical protein